MTEPKIIEARVEKVERKEPPEPEGYIGIYYDDDPKIFPSGDYPWASDSSVLYKTPEEANESLEQRGSPTHRRVVHISPAPAPAAKRYARPAAPAIAPERERLWREAVDSVIEDLYSQPPPELHEITIGLLAALGRNADGTWSEP